jgi:N-acetylmuramoyl-L-alanine amidase CwlA
VGLDGEIIQCVPIFEQSAASNERNIDTISIEVCHPEEDGKFNDVTYSSLIKLTAWLCEVTGLTEDDLIRHHDITGKNCPKYYVENPDKWETLKSDVGALIS